MSFLRPLSKLRLSPSSATPFRASTATAPRAIQVRFATQDYGSGDGNPVGENPQAQGKRGREDLEHPGPPAPKTAQKSTSSSSSSSSSASEQQKTDSGSKASEGKGSGKQGAQPKILNENPPKKQDESEDVRRHNKEMDQRAEKAHEQVSNEDAAKDKVPKKFWKGQGGRDAEP